MADKEEVDSLSHTSNVITELWSLGLAGKDDGMMMIDREAGTALPAASRQHYSQIPVITPPPPYAYGFARYGCITFDYVSL